MSCFRKIVSILPFLVLALTAKGQAALADGEPTKIKVGVYILNAGKLDITAGTYILDFYVTFRSERDMGEQKFEFMNGRATSSDLIVDRPREKTWRIQADLMTNLDLKHFPWDHQSLPLLIESPSKNSRELIYELDSQNTGIDPAIFFPGWTINDYRSSIVEHDYPAYNETFSQYKISLEITRVMLGSSIKTLLPTLCFMLVTLSSLLLGIKSIDARIGMNTAMLISAVMFHLSISNQLPAIGYLTLADRVMLSTYLSIGANLGLSVLMAHHGTQARMEQSERVRRTSIKLVPALTGLAYLFALLL